MSVTVTLAQLNIVESKRTNLERILSVIQREVETDILVFPEYAMGVPSGNPSRKYFEENAEFVDGRFVSAITAQSTKKDFMILLPIYEKTDNNHIYNTALIIENGKVKGGYRKIHMFDALGYKESNLFTKGTEACLFQLKEFTCGIVICYDIRFPELLKSQVKAGAEVIFVPAAWYKGPAKEEQWQTLLMARAHENTSYIVGVGNANEVFIGRSLVVDPFGIKNLDLGMGDRVGHFTLDKTLLNEARRRLPIIKQSHQSSYPCKLI